MITFPGGERLNGISGGEGGGGLSWKPILENPEGGRGHTKNPFRGGYGYFLEPHNTFCHLYMHVSCWSVWKQPLTSTCTEKQVVSMIFILALLSFCRIIDNMPVTWCYEVADEPSKYCSTGFPIGCHVSEDGQARDACVTSVRFPILFKQTLVYSVMPSGKSQIRVNIPQTSGAK